jgi:hypothetical protein
MGFQYRNSFLIEIIRKVVSTCVDDPVCPLVVKEGHIPFELMRLLAVLKLDFKPFWQLLVIIIMPSSRIHTNQTSS